MNNYYGEIITEYLTNYICFIVLSVEIFSILFTFGVVNQYEYQIAPTPPDQTNPDYPARTYLLCVLQSLLPTQPENYILPFDIEGNAIDLIPYWLLFFSVFNFI